jgi:general secretion pathway protein K
MGRFLRNNRGMALILTILIISLIVALTIQFNTSMRSDLHAAVNVRDGIRFGYVAKSGFNYALAVLIQDASEGNVDSLHDAWTDSKALSENLADLFDEGRFELKVSDHSGRIQINNLVDGNNYNSIQKDILTRFLQSPKFGLEDEDVDNIVSAIKDWIDEDDDPTGFGGAENSYYQTLDIPYSCKNAPVEFLEELLLVRGITKELFYGTKERPGIVSFLSPYGDGRINISTADSPVLRALLPVEISDEMKDEMVQDMLAYREDEDNDLSKTDWYKSVPGMDGVNIDPSLLTTSSTHFEITSKAFKDTMAKQVTGMVERKEDGFDIVSWKIE